MCKFVLGGVLAVWLGPHFEEQPGCLSHVLIALFMASCYQSQTEEKWKTAYRWFKIFISPNRNLEKKKDLKRADQIIILVSD